LAYWQDSGGNAPDSCRSARDQPEERLNADLKQEMGKQVPVPTKAKLREAANSHMMRLEQNPERVICYFQDKRVRYAA